MKKRIENEDTKNIKGLIMLLVIVVLVCVGLYFLTENVLLKKTTTEEETKEVTFDYDIATIGTMFNRPETKYYVLMYSTEKEAEDYETLLTKYRSSDNYIKTYFIDLDLKINSSALKEELNKKPTNSSEVSVKEATLFEINNGKVVKCYTTLDKISEILK